MKKTLSIIFIFALILIGITGNVFAVTEDIDPSLRPYVDKYLDELNNGSKQVGSIEDILKNAENLKTAVEELEYSIIPMSSVFDKRVNVPTFRQETSYWCGPACIKQSVHCINGSSDSQSTYASSMGTTSKDGTYVYKMVNELNKRQSSFTYKYEYISNLALDKFKTRIMVSAASDKPIIFHCNTKYLYMYNGASLGHYITGSGFFESVSPPSNPPKQPCVYYVDPYYKDYGRGSVLGNHSDSYQNIFNSIVGNAGYIIW